MRSSQAQFRVGVCLLSAILGVLPLTAMAATYVPIGDGIDHVYRGIPFQIYGAVLDTRHVPEYTDSEGNLVPAQIILSAVQYLSTAGRARELHIIQHCAYSTNVPTGAVVGHLTAFYTDGSSSGVDLIMGFNTAEWAWEHAALYIPGCLKHGPVEPAYTKDEGEWNSRLYYVSIPLADKDLAYLELTLDENSYTHEEWQYGCCGWDWFALAALALTIEYPPIAATVDIDPDTLNLRDQGQWITAYLSLPAGFDVADIDPAGLRLNGQVSAARSQVQDDGQTLMIKFDRAAVIGIVQVGEVQLTVAGVVGGDTHFEGTDTIRVIDPGKGKKK